MTTPGPALTRFAALFVAWIMLAGLAPADLIVGLMAAAAATWVSLLLLPARHGRPSLAALVTYLLRFPAASAMAGFDVARRAFAPRLPMKTGFVTCPLGLEEGPARAGFCALMSLMPGTLPVAAQGDSLVLHCLDVDQPVAVQCARDEALFARMIGTGARHG
jgi:multicomponent Na+:H+ antiporter subunit E